MTNAGLTNSYTNVVDIPQIPINARIVTQPHTYYTCPAGKKAIFKGNITCTNRGAAASANLRDPTDSFNLATWNNNSAVTQNVLWGTLSENAVINVEMELEAGDVIKTTQSTGTNAEFNVTGQVQEADA